MAKTDTDTQDTGSATDEEHRFFAEVLHKLVPLTETIKRIELRFGEDSDNAPAVWITIVTNSDVNPSKRKIEELNLASEKLRSAIFKSSYTRWPYVQIKSE